VTDAEKELAKIKDILREANTRTMAADRLYAMYPELDNTTATRRARELNR